MHPPALLFAGTLVCLPLTQASVLTGPSVRSVAVVPPRAPSPAHGVKSFETSFEGEIVTCKSGGSFPLSLPSEISAIPEPSSTLALGALLASGMMIRQRRRS